jgi:hypothetical protein
MNTNPKTTICGAIAALLETATYFWPQYAGLAHAASAFAVALGLALASDAKPK